MGLFSRKDDDGAPRGTQPQERVEMPTKFGFGMGNQMMKWGNQQMADATQMLAGMNQGGMQQRVLATGLDGTATIRAFRDTGQKSNLNPVFELDLHVEVPGLSPYDLSRVSEVNVIAMPELVVGGRIGVKVDPADPSQVVLRWLGATISS